ncbi:glycosyltransferase [Streptomyces sp. CAU 1734]|uniref:glycosyltransferase n=1 Tax=Streptomyces sp. CAU 1734 TaxID=3140360 RepID=UPI003260E452
MRVLQVITGLGVGGAEQQLRLLLRHLPVECEVVTLTHPGAVAEGLRADGVRVHHLGMRGNRDLRALPRLTRLIRDGGYDLVHTHLYRACVYGRIAARLAGVRAVVATEHSLGDTEIEGRPLTRPTRALYLGTERLGAATVAVSETVAGRLREWGVPGGRVRVVPNGIDAAGFAFDPAARAAVRARFGIPPEEFIVGAVGRLVPGKRFDVLVRAVAALPGVRLLIAGDGPERPALTALAARLGAADRMHFLGECDGGPGAGDGSALGSGPGSGSVPVTGFGSGFDSVRVTGSGSGFGTGSGSVPVTEPWPGSGSVPRPGEGAGADAAPGVRPPPGECPVPASCDVPSTATATATAAGSRPRPAGALATGPGAVPVPGSRALPVAGDGAGGPPAGPPGARAESAPAGPVGVPALLSAVDVLVSASRAEAFGLAVVEALAAGLPVLHSTCPAVDDLPASSAPGARRFDGTAESLTTALYRQRAAGPVPPESRLRQPPIVRHYDIARSGARLMAVYAEVAAARTTTEPPTPSTTPIGRARP